MIKSSNEADIWYLVGLIATDGNLSPDGRHVDITAKDNLFLELVRKKLLINNRVCPKYNSQGDRSYKIQISDKSFYNFLIRIGLIPNKSLTLGPIEVPDSYFSNFLRGVIDGDGDMHRWIHPTNKKEQWSLRISTASKQFAEWLMSSINRKIGVTGKIHVSKNSKNLLYKLKFGKIAAKMILQKCYIEANRERLDLQRKYTQAVNCLSSKAVWKRSKTILS